MFLSIKQRNRCKAHLPLTSLYLVPINLYLTNKLYLNGDSLYAQKELFEPHLCTKTIELFDIKDKIVFYDLTDTYTSRVEK